MKAMRGIYDGKHVSVFDPVPVDEPVEVDIVPRGAATALAVLTRDEVQAKLAMLFATLEGLTEEQLAALHDARIDQTTFFRPDAG